MKSTKKSFIGALVALVICFTMLVGSTLAWFTDSASVGIQTITTGNLNLTVEDSADDNANSLEGQILTWQKKNANVGDPIWWEPGATYETNEFYIKNEGNLNLKFKIALDDFQGDLDLLNVISFDIVADASQIKFNTGAVSVSTSGTFDLLEGYSVYTLLYGEVVLNDYVLEAGKAVGPLKVTAHMSESAGNEYMNKVLTGIGFTIIATQATGEEDSYNGTYDENSEYPTVDKEDKTSEAINLTTSDIALDVPANAPAGEYVMNVSNQKIDTNAETNQTTISFDLELYLNGEEVEAVSGVEYTVSLNVGTMKDIAKIIHNGDEITEYDYEPFTGVLSFKTSSFSPFEITFAVPDSFVVEGGDYEIDQEVVAGSTIEVAEDETVVLNLDEDLIINAETGIVNKGTLTINGNGTIKAENYVIENTGTLIINNGTFEGKGIIRSKSGSVTINDGNFLASSRWQDGTYQHTLKVENTVAVINGGNFDATVNNQSNAVINVSTDATLTINGGSFKNVAEKLANFDPYLFTYEKNGKLVINDGTFFGGWRFNGETTSTEINGGNFVVSHDGQSFHANSTHKLTISGGTFTPNTQYPNASLAGKVEANLAKYYVANEVEGNIVVSVQPGTGKVAYRAYVLNGSRRAIQIDMEKIFAMESLVVELWYDDTLLSTTTYLGSYPCDRPGYTTCAVGMPGSFFPSWNTEYAEGVVLSNLNVPNAIKVYADGELVDTFTHKSGSVLADKLNDYLALKDVTIINQITPENYTSIELESNKSYVLSGDFGGERVSLVMAEGVENVVLDGSNATNIEELIVTQNGKMIDNAIDHIGERSGKVTIQNFTVLSGIDVFACKTEVEICGNKAEALSVYAGNCAINIHHNEFDSKGETHSIYQNSNTVWSGNEYAVTLRIYDYDLKFDYNVATNAVGHVVAINGYQGTFNVEVENNIQSFTNNNLTVNSTIKNNRAALKIWDDFVYAPNTAQNEVNANAQAVIDSVLAEESNNVITLVGETHHNFSIYNVNVND